MKRETKLILLLFFGAALLLAGNAPGTITFASGLVSATGTGSSPLKCTLSSSSPSSRNVNHDCYSGTSHVMGGWSYAQVQGGETISYADTRSGDVFTAIIQMDPVTGTVAWQANINGAMQSGHLF